MPRRITMFTVLLLILTPVGHAQDVISVELRDEVSAQAVQLGELLRHDVETIAVETQFYTEVALFDSARGQSLGTGVLIPIGVEGRGSGNSVQEYLALYQIMAVDGQFLSDMGAGDNTHKAVALLAFVVIDGLTWRTVYWETRKVRGNRMVVQACKSAWLPERCPDGDRGEIVVEFDGRTYGPNLWFASNGQ